MDAAEILTLYAPFRDATPQRRRLMLSDVTATTLPAGYTAFSTGARCGSVALVGRGSIRVAKTDAGGREITLYHVGPGETCLLTLNCALTGERYDADGATEEEVEAALIPVDRFRAWFDDDPNFRDFVVAAIAHRVTELMRRIEEVAFRDLRTRVARYLQHAALHGVEHCIAITHDALAVEVGASRESVSRILKDLEHVGVIGLGRGRIRVIDATRLVEHAGESDTHSAPCPRCRPDLPGLV